MTGRTFLLVLICLAAPLAAGGAQQRTTSPHGQIDVECAVCHRPESWTAIRVSKDFDHGKSGFPLEGAHAQTSCRACHESLDFSGTPRACSACHEDLHRGELGGDCVQCHTPRSFLDRTAMVRAHAATRFPLDGAHLLTDCRDCHQAASQGRLAYVGRSGRCVDCHQASYAAATNPDHQAVGFSTDCTSCHSTRRWAGARFDHRAAGFPLTGAHAALTCDQCHTNFSFGGTPVECVSCHRPDYDATTDPNHAAVSIPTDCAGCHSTVTWDGARFDHDGRWFPIYSGEHRGKWSSCSECHVVATDYAQFTCASCHRQTEMDDHHKDISGYGPAPQDCVRCHPRGNKP